MNPELMVVIGGRLKEARQAAGLSQQDVASVFRIRRQLISAWECGRSMPTLEQWHALAPMYGVSLDWLIYGVAARHEGGSAMLDLIFQRPGVHPTGVGQHSS